jgi:myo-inositol-1(or 4)-monophosphatase
VREVDVAIEAARAAGRVLAARGRAAEVRHKGAIDLVTEVDLSCEAAIREVLARHTPDVAVHAEEGGGAAGAPTRWVVDPLDGTTNFVHGFPYYAASIALVVDGAPVAGAVLDGPRGDVYAAARGQGAWCGEAPLRVSTRARLAESLVGTGFPYDRQQPGRARFYLARVEAVMQRSHGIRRCGAAALDLVQVACGRLDAFWEFGLAPWDVAAGMLIVAEAGGRVTGHDGAPLDLDHPAPLASNGLVHDELIAVLANV